MMSLVSLEASNAVDIMAPRSEELRISGCCSRKLLGLFHNDDQHGTTHKFKCVFGVKDKLSVDFLSVLR